MRILISNVFKNGKVEHINREGKVSKTRNTRSQSPQNICNIIYNTYKITVKKLIILSKSWSVFENIVSLRGLLGLRGLV
jgi:hypothetical protein